MKRTADVSLDKSFEYTGEIVKAFVDPTTGERHIRGVASGLEEDRDGERVSKRAIASMGKQIAGGEVKFTAGHAQDWMTEIGDIVGAEIDKKTDQLVIDAKLPPEGIDAIADKGWMVVNKGKVGFSIGGKLEHAYHELTDLGKKRKVLDAIRLKHICLTKNPSYSHSFAEAVSKTFEGDPDESEFTLDAEVEKDVAGSWAPGGGGNSGQDSETGGKRNAGSKKPGSKGMDVQDEGKDDPEDDDDEETVEPTDRHMSCPQCGHEFAADIPVDMTPEERAEQDKRKTELEDSVPGDGSGGGSKDDEEQGKPAESASGNEPDNDKDDDDQDDKKKKSSKPSFKSREATMDLEKRIADLEALVAKSGETEGNTEPVEKTDAEGEKLFDKGAVPEGVLKMVALATGDQEDRLEKTRQDLSEGFEILGKAVMEMREAIGNLPTGRKSTARVLKNGREDDQSTLEDQIAKTESPVEALKLLNKATYGIE